jgi:AcrR family transcriptional regulator
MSRPSLAEVRKAQILDAVEACILEYGIDGVSFARVGQMAGVRSSIVPHYFGSKGALMTAMVDRVLDRVQGILDRALDGLEGHALLDGLLRVLFGGPLNVAPVAKVLDQLRASAYFNDTTRQRLVEMYHHFEAMAVAALETIHPDADPDRRRAVAYGLVCLGDANNSFRATGFPAGYDAWARTGAEVLLASLEADDRADAT